MAVHAIGDLALDTVLDVFDNATAAMRAKHPGSTLQRHRIEHAQHLSGPAVAKKLAGAGVHVVANPLHLLPDKRILVKKLGPTRAGAGHSYALRTMHDVSTLTKTPCCYNIYICTFVHCR